NMDHTYSNSRVQHIWINDRPMNEALINAAYAGYHGVPVALVSGDKALEDELKPILPDINYVCTKEGLAKFAAKNYSLARVNRELRDAVRSSLAFTNLQVYCFDAPIRLKIEFYSTAMADVVALMPGTKRINGKTIVYEHDDYAVLFNALMALITLAYATGI
ncbi:MAG: M55 family metallopeptidase, partial [Candidatus Cloacimonetes bacterium]|nr:M55 family metallopeptidase [Candidatus Cloacimonadota bacterium]